MLSDRTFIRCHNCAAPNSTARAPQCAARPHLRYRHKVTALTIAIIASTTAAFAQSSAPLTTNTAAVPLSIELKAGSAAETRLTLPRQTTSTPSGAANAQLLLRSGTVYIRHLTLNYGGSTGRQDAVEVQIRRLVLEAEQIAAVPLTKSGKPLTSIVVLTDPNSIASATHIELDLGNNGSSNSQSNQQNKDRRIPSITTGTLPASASIPTTSWPLVASLRADATNARQVLPIGRDKGPMKDFEISARSGAMAIIKVRFVLANSEPIELDAVGELGPNLQPLRISLDAVDAVREIVVITDPRKPTTSRPVIEVRARQNDDWNGALGQNRIKTGGWVLLGTVTIANQHHTRPDKTAFALSGAEGKFQRLRLIARRQAVTMLNIVVDPGDGPPQTIPVNATLQPDVSSPMLSLPSATMAINRISLQPVVHNRVSIDAAVEVWAQY
ncbi:MAG: hypothetical protein ABL898_02680 [Hyphomicrobiaceae bacterium]|nr:hypothetical protein [Hyphomicrobiaceae bacterium]